MDWLFKKIFGDTLPDDAVIRWIFATYGWILENRGGFDTFLRNSNLVLPLNKNFPGNGEGHARAEEIFLATKRHAGLSTWPCILEQQGETTECEVTVDGKKEIINAAGTFSMDWNQTRPRITYSPDQLENLETLVALFAHELSHYFLATIPLDQPCGPDAEEPATDLCAVYLGFGIFMANNAREYASGAVVARRGYLGELTLSYALAIFSELHSLSPKDVRKHLRTNPSSFFESAVRDINTRWCPEMRKLRQIRPHSEI